MRGGSSGSAASQDSQPRAALGRERTPQIWPAVEIPGLQPHTPWTPVFCALQKVDCFSRLWVPHLYDCSYPILGAVGKDSLSAPITARHWGTEPTPGSESRSSSPGMSNWGCALCQPVSVPCAEPSPPSCLLLSSLGQLSAPDTPPTSA